MRSESTATELDNYTVPSLLLEVHRLRLRIIHLTEKVSKLPGIQNPSAPSEVIEDSLKEGLELKRKLDINIDLFHQLKYLLRRRGYTW